MTRKYIIIADDSIKGFDEGIAKLEREWEAEEIEPSEDCISRKTALKAFAEECAGECACCEYNGSGYDTAENCKLIKSLPPVTPQQKIGKWMATENEDMNIVGYYCSCCDLPMETEEKTTYCPNCGAKMEVEE